MEQVKEKANAFTDTEKWWVEKDTESGKWCATPPLSKHHHLELHGEFSRHDAALAFAIAESHQ